MSVYLLVYYCLTKSPCEARMISFAHHFSLEKCTGLLHQPNQPANMIGRCEKECTLQEAADLDLNGDCTFQPPGLFDPK